MGPRRAGPRASRGGGARIRAPVGSGLREALRRLRTGARARAGRYRIGSALFLRLLGAVYTVAFLSLWVQVEGLVGSGGILPAAPFLEGAAAELGAERFWRLPTLLWLGAGDAALHAACAAGVGLALLVVLGAFQAPALLGCWALYLSLAVVGRVFLSYQWDALLLETGLLAVFLLPARGRRPLAGDDAPSPLALGLLGWLLLRLLVSSGAVKLSSGDEAWRSLEALRFHFETQPLPTPAGFLAHQLPDALLRAGTLGTFAVELALPFGLLAPPRARRFVLLALVAFQAAIALTGNYGFFNLLAAALCLPLLDDAAFPARLRARLGPERPRGRRPGGVVLVLLALLVVPVSAVHGMRAAGLREAVPRAGSALARAVAPFRSVKGYGLFAVMTTRRPEIRVEGSRDGETWRRYRFRYKPGDPERAPPWVAPHMPRLDWQMWFAALSSPRRSPWLLAFLARLAEGAPEVEALLAESPFPEEPPRYLRARRREYRFTELDALLETGRWWERGSAEAYVPALPAAELRRLGRRLRGGG